MDELLELLLEQLNRTQYSEEHADELPLSFTVPALERELGSVWGKRAIQESLDFLVSQGRVMARRGDRSGQLLYKLAVEGDTNHALSPVPKHKPIGIAFGDSPLSSYSPGFARTSLRPARTLGSSLHKEGAA